MTIDLVIELYREMLRTAALVAAPILGVAMMIGLTVSLIQTVTSIQEQTLTFVPKIIGIALTVGIGMPWRPRSTPIRLWEPSPPKLVACRKL